MDVLSETMSRLCADITSLRRARQELKQTLTRETLTRKAAVGTLCHDFAAMRAQMSHRRGKERITFLANLQRCVNQQRQAVRNDLSGARFAWMGKAEDIPSRGRQVRQPDPSTRSRNR
jgi:hypothetical protein